MNWEKIADIKFDGIDHSDYPRYCDAYVSECTIDGISATDEQLEEINENRDFVYEKLWNYLY